MSKIVLINDTHFGVKNNHPLFRQYINSFFQTKLFPYIDANNIKEIVHLGDVFDHRKQINIETLRGIRLHFLAPLQERGVRMHVILGNHDVYHKNTNEVNSVQELLSFYDNIKVYDKCQDVDLDGIPYAFIPWLTADNEAEFQAFLKTSRAAQAMGHFELQGYEVLRGVPSTVGMSAKVLKQFERVYSGHFHQKSDDGHVLYLGTQYDTTHADTNEIKGFHVLDTITKQIDFVPNSEKMFYRIYYDDTRAMNTDFGHLKDKYVKLIVKSKKKQKLFDDYLTAMYAINPAEVNIIEEQDLSITSADEVDVTKDTLSIIFQDIDGNPDIENPIKIKELMNELYLQSYEIEDD